ncbi:unnamed protein product [Withania somnifera]
MSIPRSKSVPYRISETQNSPTNSFIIPPTVRSSNSADSLKPSWPKKVNEATKGGSSSNNSKSFTANNLKEFNKRNGIQEERRYSPRSPYYQGLTDSSKEINRQKLLAELGTTPGKDSSLSSSTSKSNFSVKVQEWSAVYFVRKSKEERSSSSLNVSSGNKNIRDPSSSETKEKRVIRTTIGEELGIHSRGVRGARKNKRRNSQLAKGKSLRERALEMQTNIVLLPTPAPPVTSPPNLSLPSSPPTPLVLQTSSQDKEIELVQSLPASPTQTVDIENDTIKENDVTVPAEQIDKRYIWAEKYRPTDLKDFLCNQNTALELNALTQTDGGPRHFIFAGQPGVGKRTMIFALLHKAFGHEKLQAKEKYKVFYLKGEAVPSIQINVKESKKHVEINISETKGYEKHVMVELINERKHKTSSKSAPRNPDNCKAIILCEADKISTDALLYIKWMIERYEGCYTVFFCCSDITKLQPIKSICKVVHLQKPSDDENQEIKTGWEDDIAKIAKNIIEEQSPKQLYDVRGKLQNLIEHNVSAEFIFNTIVKELKSNLDDQFHKEVDTLKMKYNINSKDHEQGKSDNDAVKTMVHKFMKIEEFIAKFMSWYKLFVLKKGNHKPILSKGDL